MPNKHFCQGTHCHTIPTTDRFLKSKGIIRGRYARLNVDYDLSNSIIILGISIFVVNAVLIVG